ncbi:MAG: beta-lactamase family protein [Acetobacteraceae bacterium]|nr:beta-lactamase family protein [Acetobacteraceae bacterium]
MGGSPAIDQRLAQAVEQNGVPGVVAAVTNRDGLDYEGAFGKRNVAASAPMTADTVFWIASMTKAVTSVAALQLVEQGKLSLDGPIGDLLPGLTHPQVLEGFAADGKPLLRPARSPITLRHLLTHTSGFGYDFSSAEISRYVQYNCLPAVTTCQTRALDLPLLFDPGERWEYGISTDYVGLAIEAASGERLEQYFHRHVLAPLGMKDTGFVLRPEQKQRLAAMHQRMPDGRLQPIPFAMPETPEFFTGGGGLYSTALDYARFMRTVLNQGRADGGRILKPETCALLICNQVGSLQAGVIKTANPALSNEADPFPGMPCHWSLAFLINPQPSPLGRSAGSLSWGGLANTFYWIDPGRGLGAVILMQMLPFADPKALSAAAGFEQAIYAA